MNLGSLRLSTRLFLAFGVVVFGTSDWASF